VKLQYVLSYSPLLACSNISSGALRIKHEDSCFHLVSFSAALFSFYLFCLIVLLFFYVHSYLP
jgi:hypothetical protein